MCSGHSKWLGVAGARGPWRGIAGVESMKLCWHPLSGAVGNPCKFLRRQLLNLCFRRITGNSVRKGLEVSFRASQKHMLCKY